MSLLYRHAREFGIELDHAQQSRFEAYYRLLSEWNERFNLTAITEYTAVQIKHFLDSLSAAPLLSALAQDGQVIDVGAGAGLPGVPLAITFPYLHFTMLEATGKKVRFLDQLILELGLENAVAVQGRAEELAHAKEHRAMYAAALARALAPMPTLVEYMLPFVRVGGMLVAYKGIEAVEEARAASRAIQTLGGRLREIVPVQLPTLSAARHLVVVDKVKETPPRYPRRSGMPVKKPL